MNFQKKLAGVAFVATALGAMPFAFGWGSYGHQQVNEAALQLMDADLPLTACFRRNSILITRYAITPDYEWKKVGVAPADEALRRKKASNDYFEHPLHFFEPDAFIKNGAVTATTIATLPSGDYPKVFSEYQRLRTENETYVVKMDPAKHLRSPKLAAPDEVASHGTAPWRIRQLFRLGVDAIKTGDARMAMYYLGTIGHYVGDMSQPFHGSLDYDGKSSFTTADGAVLPPTPGIHAVFETRMMANASKAFTGGKADANTQLWRSFEATEKSVLARGREVLTGKPALNESLITATALQLVGGGFPYLEPLLKEYGKALGLHPHAPAGAHDLTEEDHHVQKSARPGAAARTRDPAPSEGSVRDFMKGNVLDPVTGKAGSVVNIASTRLGEGAATLARMWNAAYEQAKLESPDMPDLSKCDPLEFDLAFAIQNYPRPDYLPKGAYLPPAANPNPEPPETSALTPKKKSTAGSKR